MIQIMVNLEICAECHCRWYRRNAAFSVARLHCGRSLSFVSHDENMSPVHGKRHRTMMSIYVRHGSKDGRVYFSHNENLPGN